MISHTAQRNHTDASKDRAALLRSRAHDFCRSLISPPPPRELLKEFFTSDNPSIKEHGPSWATSHLHFLGREFMGVDGCVEYFELLSQSLRMHLDEDSFPGKDALAVDADTGKVSVVGKGKFESVATGRSWDEKFTYVLSNWDEDGRIGKWDIWADPLSAWAAVAEHDVDNWKKGEHRSLVSISQHFRE
ncbi:hypothetical protein JX266_001709 [Neoarthrinium moseri]|nr:hypothetical protein JX266_001709 [Neoarthrinium moseri]